MIGQRLEKVDGRKLDRFYLLIGSCDCEKTNRI